MMTMESLESVLTESVEAVKQREISALDRLLAAHHHRCVLYGAGTLGRQAANLFREIGVEPLAFVDSNPERWCSEVAGLSVLSPAEAAGRYGSDAIFFVTIWNDFHWFIDTQGKLEALGCKSISSYAPIFWRFGKRFMEMRLLHEPPHHLYKRLGEVLEAERLWSDEESLATYRANIVWRALGDPSHLPYPPPKNTYFPEDIFQLSSDEVIVDCGAFDGDTLRMLLGVTDQFKEFHAIEADTVSIARMRSYLAALESEVRDKVKKHDCAVGAERCTLKFAMTGSITAKAEGAGVDVACIPIDELFADTQVTFMKMDIEGAEFDALRGAAAVIRRDQPILAICVYHTQADVWRVPLLLRSLNPSYAFYLRAYDGDGLQSVVYAVPPRRFKGASGIRERV
jgi:FkbM family methyltransferase